MTDGVLLFEVEEAWREFLLLLLVDYRQHLPTAQRPPGHPPLHAAEANAARISSASMHPHDVLHGDDLVNFEAVYQLRTGNIHHTAILITAAPGITQPARAGLL